MKPALKWTSRFAVVLLISEVLLRLLFSNLSLAERLSRVGRTGRMIFEIEQLKQAETLRKSDITNKKGWGALQVDREVGWTNSPGAMTHAELPVTVNQQGLRADHEYALYKPAGKSLRVEVLGDSFTFGRDVGDGDTFASQLQAMRPQFDVLNLGVPGYGLDQTVLDFEWHGVQFHPDVVVLNAMSTLPARDESDFTSWYKPYFTVENGELIPHGTPIPTVEEAVSEYQRRPRLFDFARLLVEVSRKRNTDSSSLEEKLLNRFVEDVRAAGARPLILLAPDNDLIECALFAQICQARKLDCLDIRSDFSQAAAAGVPLAAGVHWSAQGNRIVASDLAANLDGIPGLAGK